MRLVELSCILEIRCGHRPSVTAKRRARAVAQLKQHTIAGLQPVRVIDETWNNCRIDEATHIPCFGYKYTHQAGEGFEPESWGVDRWFGVQIIALDNSRAMHEVEPADVLGEWELIGGDARAHICGLQVLRFGREEPLRLIAETIQTIQPAT